CVAEETEDQRAKRMAALKVKDELKKKRVEEKVAWYCEQKAARATEDSNKRRNFSTAVGVVEEKKETSSLEDDIMTFKNANPQKEAEVLWNKKLKDPNTKTIMRRGEVCIHEFAGVEVRARGMHGMSSTLRQRADIQTQSDLQQYEEDRESRVERARQRLEVERTANLESGPGAEEKLIPLLTVSKDLGEIREQEEQRDEMLYQQATALQQAKKQEQAEKKRKAEEEGLSLPIEMLAYKASVQKAQRSMMDSLLKGQTVLAGLEQECEKITTGEGEALKQEGKAKLDQ
ncbi:unnamed protein product, partial [Symbiodinium sp. CCMP2456]